MFAQDCTKRLDHDKDILPGALGLQIWILLCWHNSPVSTPLLATFPGTPQCPLCHGMGKPISQLKCRWMLIYPRGSLFAQGIVCSRFWCLHQSRAGERLWFSLQKVHTSSDGIRGYTECMQPSASFQATGIALAKRLAMLVAEQSWVHIFCVIAPVFRMCHSASQNEPDNYRVVCDHEFTRSLQWNWASLNIYDPILFSLDCTDY